MIKGPMVGFVQDWRGCCLTSVAADKDGEVRSVTAALCAALFTAIFIEARAAECRALHNITRGRSGNLRRLCCDTREQPNDAISRHPRLCLIAAILRPAYATRSPGRLQNYQLCPLFGDTKYVRTAKDLLADTEKARWPRIPW